ncbi:MAG: cobalamin biosynthesis protein CobD [Lachnospiraceae bacterium]|nr:cobalamin biosynthesis protein CobD [Lachnospiraceae bacterium]
MKYHMIAFLLGFLLDLMLGDPYCLPHPIRAIGNLIAKLEKRLLGTEATGSEKEKLRKGGVLVLAVLGITVTVTTVILLGAYWLHPYVGIAMETIMTYQILATKCMKVESMKVYRALKHQTLEDARKAVSMIVGRDTAALDEEGVAKAAVETVAESTSDGVIAPMLYTALGGPILGFFYKAANTMDSMVGYKNDRYLYFGRTAAKLDDLVNFIPARISAGFMIVAAFLGGKHFSGKRAWRIFCRDRKKHASPNSAHTESVCAGALGIRLAGDASYFGKIVKKPYIGDAVRRIEYEDIKRANRLMYITAWMSEMVCLLLMTVNCLL